MPARVRKVPRAFSWVDHRLVRDGHLDGRSHGALALYLFLVTVGDSQGLSYWGENAVARRLRVGLPALRTARSELEAAGLVPEVAGVTMRAENSIELTGEDTQRMQKLLDVIEDLDDVQDVFHNAEMAETE